jgi:hypothetical protein
MKIKLYFKWFDFWVGFFYDRKKNILYIGLLPMIGIKIEFEFHYLIIGDSSGLVMGCTYNKKDVSEESNATFKRISRCKCPVCSEDI